MCYVVYTHNIYIYIYMFLFFLFYFILKIPFYNVLCFICIQEICITLYFYVFKSKNILPSIYFCLSYLFISFFYIIRLLFSTWSFHGSKFLLCNVQMCNGSKGNEDYHSSSRLIIDFYLTVAKGVMKKKFSCFFKYNFVYRKLDEQKILG